MALYYVTIILFFFLGIIMSGGKNKKQDQAYLLVCFAIMLILHTFVNPEYSDNYNYGYGYVEISKMGFADVLKYNPPSLKAEVGYRVLCKLLSYISANWVFGLFVISIIILLGYYRTTKAYSTSYLISVLLIMVGPFLQSTYVLRQHLAMAIVLLSYTFIIEKKIVPYLIICTIAILFHQTALIFMPVYFLYHISKNKFAIVSAIMFFVLTSFMSYFLTMAGVLAMDTAGYGDYYFEQDMDKGANSKMTLLMLSLLILRMIILKRNFFDKGITRLMSIVMVLGVIFSIAGLGFIGSSRMNMYFTSASFLYIPNTFYYLKNKSLRDASCLGFFFFLLYFVIKNASNFDGIWFISPDL